MTLQFKKLKCSNHFVEVSNNVICNLFTTSRTTFCLQVTEDDLMEFFSKYGRIVHTKVVRDRANVSKG